MGYVLLKTSAILIINGARYEKFDASGLPTALTYWIEQSQLRCDCAGYKIFVLSLQLCIHDTTGCHRKDVMVLRDGGSRRPAAGKESV